MAGTGSFFYEEASMKKRDLSPRSNNMPQHKAALKRISADRKRYIKNQQILNDLKTRIRHLRKLIAEKKAAEALSALAVVISKLNKAAGKKVIHKNKASRTVSRLTKAVRGLK